MRALAAFSLLLSAMLASPAAAQTTVSRCTFNGASERCSVHGWADGTGTAVNLAIVWLSDGKSTYYSLDLDGTARIREDNGRYTPAAWSSSGAYYVIRSARGNVTRLPVR